MLQVKQKGFAHIESVWVFTVELSFSMRLSLKILKWLLFISRRLLLWASIKCFLIKYLLFVFSNALKKLAACIHIIRVAEIIWKMVHNGLASLGLRSCFNFLPKNRLQCGVNLKTLPANRIGIYVILKRNTISDKIPLIGIKIVKSRTKVENSHTDKRYNDSLSLLKTMLHHAYSLSSKAEVFNLEMNATNWVLFSVA